MSLGCHLPMEPSSQLLDYQGGGETPRLMMFSRSDLAVVTRQGDVLLSNNVLHVTADIENIGKQCFQH